MKKIFFTEPDINKKDTIELLKKTIDNNFPNEGKLTNKLEEEAKKRQINTIVLRKNRF